MWYIALNVQACAGHISRKRTWCFSGFGIVINEGAVMKRRKRTVIGILTFLLAAAAALFFILAWRLGKMPWQQNGKDQDTYKKAEDFQVETVKSSVDFDQDGIDDYTDIMLGARADQEKKPVYRDGYYDGGYPPEGEGVCTDVIWHGFQAAGYSLKDMVDRDIAARLDAYPSVETPDPNIDFRRVKTLRTFFETYCVSLSLDPNDIAEWQPGDLVLFGDERQHIGIVSDRRSKEGRPYIIHNMGQKNREEDYLKRTKMEITGHFRFDASRIPEDVLVPD